MKTVCIYHSVDLDGWMSAAIVKLTYAIDIDFIGYNYNQPYPDLSEYERVIMVDISFPVEIMKNIKGTLIWIDHHISAIKDCFEIDESTDGIRNTKYAACELTWMFFFPNIKVPEIVRLLGRYDCFGHKGTEEERKVLIFQYAARSRLTNYDECYKALIDVKDSYIEGWLNVGDGIYSYLCTEAKQTYEKSFLIILDGYKFASVNKERFNPINFGIDYHKDGYDGFACFHYEKGMFSYSLYNDNEKVDVSIIAKNRSGGGHKGASGFRTEKIIIA